MERYGIGKTDVGLVRQNNEDSFLVCNEAVGKLGNVYVVADGMGGHQAGEVASSAAIAQFCAYLRENIYSLQYTEALLAEAVLFANNKVFDLSLADESKQGMGTTFSVCCFDENNLYYAHVGDSRIYMLSNGALKQLTKDHTYVEEMMAKGLMTAEESENNLNRHMLTRALGTEYGVQVDAGYVPLAEGDIVLLCSDGLTNMLDDDTLAAVLRGEGGIENKADDLVTRALANGGQDNVTVVLL